MANQHIKRLTEILKGRICQNGRMVIPAESFHKPVEMEFEVDGKRVEMIKAEDKSRIREFMIKTFYESAPIPKALQLAKKLEKYPYLNNELDMMLNSGCSKSIKDISSRHLVGACFNTVWWVKPDLVLDPDEFKNPVAWLQVAGNIANTFHNNNGSKSVDQFQDPVIVWRDFQFQLIYYMLNREAQLQGKEFVLYGGMSYAEPRHRTKNLGLTLMRVATDWATRNNGIYGFAGTFPGFKNWVDRSGLTDQYRLLAEIPYRDMTLLSNQGQSLMGHLPDGMILMASKD